MKSCFIYLTFSVLLIICYFEKKSAATAAAAKQTLKRDKPRFFIGPIAGDDGRQAQVPGMKMKLQITGGLVKGSYCRANSDTEVDLIGRVNRGNELMMIELADGETTGTFKGIVENAGNQLLKLSGNWTGGDKNTPCQFLVEEVREYPKGKAFEAITGKKLKIVALR